MKATRQARNWLAGVGMLLLGRFVPWAAGDVRLPNVFSDHAVLQRQMPVPIWGWAEPGEKVTVTFAGQQRVAGADDTGRWVVKLDPMEAGGPFELAVRGKNAVTRSDILVGEVWLCAGHSNMGTTMAGAQYWLAECPTAAFPGIRLLNLGGNGGYSAPEPASDVPDRWVRCTPHSSFLFSAIGYFFARDVHQALGVPVGIIKCTSWGAPAEPFVPADDLAAVPLYAPRVEQYRAQVTKGREQRSARDDEYAGNLKDYNDRLAAIERDVAERDAGLKEHWENPATNASQWGTTKLRPDWFKTEMKGQGGSVWFRRDQDMVAGWLGQDLVLSLGFANGAAAVYYNGEPLVQDGGVYPVPARLVKTGRNVIVLRLVDYGGNGGIGGPEFMLYLAPQDSRIERLPMCFEWRYKVGCSVPANPSLQAPSPAGWPNQGPGALYNGMIAPLLPLACRGVIQYHGVNNGSRAHEFCQLLPVLLSSWRKAFGPDFAFVMVQEPNFMAQGKPRDYVEPEDSMSLPLGIAPIREAVLKALSSPRTAMAVTIDIGESWDIHPNNKRVVGQRLALAALGGIYGRKTVYSGPLYESMKAKGSRVRVRFRHVGGGLVSRGGELRQFMVAGADRKFVWAKAAIEGDTVVVSSDQVKAPVAVRYAFWADPKDANLYNREGLPASPFRTDDWDLATNSVKPK